MNIDKKIEKLIKWMIEFPEIQPTSKTIPEKTLKSKATSELEYKKLFKEYLELNKIYDYVKDRFYRGKLTQKQIAKCKEACLGGIFGYSRKIESLSKKYGQKEKDIYYIITKYGSVTQFVRLYMSNMLPIEDITLAKSMLKNTLDIDRKNNEGCDKLIHAITESKEDEPTLIIYSSLELLDILRILSPRERKIIDERYGITSGKSQTLETLARVYGVTRENIRRIEVNVLKKLKRPAYFDKIIYDLCLATKEKSFLQELEDIIFNSNILFKPREENKSSFEVQIDEEKFSIVISKLKSAKEKYEIEQEKAGDIHIEKLGLSVKAYNCLKRAGFSTAKEVASLSLEELSNIRNFGEKSLQEVLAKLESLGLSVISVNDLTESTEELLTPKEIIASGKDLPLKSLDLPVRICNSFKRAGYTTVIQVAELSSYQILKIRNIGRLSAEELLRKIVDLGIHINSEDLLKTSSELGSLKRQKDILQDEENALEEKVEEAKELKDKYDKFFYGKDVSTIEFKDN